MYVSKVCVVYMDFGFCAQIIYGWPNFIFSMEIKRVYLIWSRAGWEIGLAFSDVILTDQYQ